MGASKQPEVMAISRAQVKAIGAEARAVEVIEGAIEACDFGHAAAVVFARAVAGEEVTAEVVGRVLPGMRNVAVAAALMAMARGDRKAAWLDVLWNRRMPRVGEAYAVQAAVLFAAWRAGATKEEVIPSARRIVRMARSWEENAIAWTVAKEIDDANLSAAAAGLRSYGEHAEGKQIVAALERAFACSAKEHLEALPETIAAAGSGFTVRAGPRVGRNELCPCGSGQKYKRCCAEKDAGVVPSPVPGMSWEAWVTTGAERMSADDVGALPLKDLVRVEFGKLGPEPLVAVFRRFVDEQLLDRAAAMLAVIEGRDVEMGQDLREELIVEALALGDTDVAKAQMAKLAGRPPNELDVLEVALREGAPGALGKLDLESDAAHFDEGGVQSIELAHLLMKTMPGLGILVARGALRPDRPLDNESLLEAIEEARDVLNLPPGDPAWDLEAAWTEAEDAVRKEDSEIGALRASLRGSASRLEELERELAASKEELQAAAAGPAPESRAAPVVDPAARDRERQLRQKIEELQGLVREGNDERTELRRELASASSAARAKAEAGPRDAPEDDTDVGDVLPAGERGIAIPNITRRVRDALDEVPRAVAAEAMRTVGALAAGDLAAWRGVKSAQDMVRTVLMARVGIHHRLLFRIEEGNLETIDLVTRENLLATLKRIRATRA